MRVGIVGLGRMGRVHAANLVRHPCVDEVVLLGRDPARVRDAAAALHARADRRADVVVDERGIDAALPGLNALVVATTTATHPAFALRSAQSGVPSLIEKPLALDPAELSELVDRLGALGTPAMVGFHRRYDDGYRALRERVRGGDAGTVRIVRGTSHDRGPLALDYIPASGGVWRDLLIHDFDIVPWVTGQRIVAVQAFGAVLDEPEYLRYGDADTAMAVLTLESGALAVLTGTRRNEGGQDVRTEVYGSRGSYEAGLDGRLPVISTEPGGRVFGAVHEDFISRFATAFENEIDHFVRLALGEVPNLTPPSEGLASLAVAVAAEESVRTGRAVELR